MNESSVLQYTFSRLATGQNIALIAPNDAGKTRLLQQISHQHSYWLPDSVQWVFVYLAATEFEPEDTPADFWQKVWHAFAEESTGQPWRALIEKLGRSAASQPLNSSRLLRRLEKQQVRLVLLLDDLDQLTKNPHLFTPDLLGPLRSLSSRYTSFNIVFTSRQRLSELNRRIQISGSPPFNNFYEILLSELVAA